MEAQWSGSSEIYGVRYLTLEPELPWMKPLQKPAPLLGGAHGVENDDCATECSGGKNWNSTWSPTEAVMLLGVNTRPFEPTLTTCTLLGVELAAELVDAGGVEDAGG